MTTLEFFKKYWLSVIMLLVTVFILTTLSMIIGLVTDQELHDLLSFVWVIVLLVTLGLFFRPLL